MNRNIIETIMGGVVLIIAAAFLVFAYSSSNTGAVAGYQVTAKFNNVGDLQRGTDVRLSGIKIGSVIETSLDPQTYLAVVRMSIMENVKLPTDTSARILNAGLLGSSYVALEPGAEEKMIGPGGEITVTQDAINIADLLGRFVFGSTQKQGGQAPPSGGTAPATTPPAP
jgi:phospholipid/cholesterol/gamma-HCH transport system substrate-binding protein